MILLIIKDDYITYICIHIIYYYLHNNLITISYKYI